MVANANAACSSASRTKLVPRFRTLFHSPGTKDHNNFIDQGIKRHTLESDAKPGDQKLESALESARAGYESVCTFALDFFNAYLKNQPGRRAELLKKFRDTRIGGDRPHVEYLPVGASGPEPYRDDLEVPPALRQIPAMIAGRGVEATLALLQKWRAKDPATPILQEAHGFALVDLCLDHGPIADAIAVNRFYCSFIAKFSSIFLRHGDGAKNAGLKQFAMDYYKKACLLEPRDALAAARLKELTELMKK